MIRDEKTCAAARMDQATGTAIIPAVKRYVKDLNINAVEDTENGVLMKGQKAES